MALSYGGRPGIGDLNLIESAIGRPYSGYHLRIWAKSAALLESMVQNHGFIDGNKRTAWILVETFIERSGYELAIADEERVDDLVVNVACGQVSFNDLNEWFRLRLRKSDAGS
ncbi:MAG: type II toxin-antitoxin system death-on-curing family toxin [Pseudomonadota bacterium]